MKHLEQLVESIHDPDAVVYVRDMLGRYVYINDAYTRIIHKHPLEVIGKTNAEIFGPQAASWEIADKAVVENKDFAVIPEHFLDPATNLWRSFLSTKLIIFFGGESYLAGVSVEVKGADAVKYAERLIAIRETIVAAVQAWRDSDAAQ